MEQKVLVWTCVLVFASTSIITILGIVNVIKIAPSYLNRLFIALVLEIVGIGVLAFKNFLTTNAKTDFVQITMPDPGYKYSPSTGFPLYIKGAYLKLPENTLTAELKVNGTMTPFANSNNSGSVFNYQIPSTMVTPPGIGVFYVYIMHDHKIVTQDSILFSIQ
jgi:hypothetical protein